MTGQQANGQAAATAGNKFVCPAWDLLASSYKTKADCYAHNLGSAQAHDISTICPMGGPQVVVASCLHGGGQGHCLSRCPQILSLLQPPAAQGPRQPPPPIQGSLTGALAVVRRGPGSGLRTNQGPTVVLGLGLMQHTGPEPDLHLALPCLLPGMGPGADLGPHEGRHRVPLPCSQSRLSCWELKAQGRAACKVAPPREVERCRPPGRTGWSRPVRTGWCRRGC